MTRALFIVDVQNDFTEEGALGVIPILFLAQIAFIVAFGVLLDTFVVRSLLVPALSYDIGPAVWWPSKLWRRGLDGARAEHEAAEVRVVQPTDGLEPAHRPADADHAMTRAEYRRTLDS